MSIEAMKQALEALQKIYIAPEHEEYIRVWWPACEDAITSLRQAIAEAEKREWVGLTDEQIEELANPLLRNVGNATVLASYEYFARAVETKLKEKNT